MDISVKVRNCLARAGGRFKVRKAKPAASFDAALASAQLRPQQVARAVLLSDGSACLMAVVPATHEPDLDVLKAMFSRGFRVCSREDRQRLVRDCDPDHIPPLGEAFGIKTMVDRSLLELDEVYFCVGVPGLFVRAAAADFAQLQAKAWRGHSFIRPRSEQDQAEAPEEEGLRERIKRRVQQVHKLPPMPGIAAEILTLRNNPFAHISEMAAIVEQDPSLSAQLIRYAGSPFYGYQGRLQTVEQAITRVLGLDFVMDIAFGIALGKPFRNPSDGPLGLTAFWRHAIHSATLTQALCASMEYSRRPSAGVAYLAGLLHNFGFLLLGHLFPKEFERLNKAVMAEPERPILELEQALLGVSHMELGQWLMEAWDMPEEIRAAVREHHDPDYRSDFSIYANLVYVANQLLKRRGMGDAAETEIPPELLRHLGLSPAQVESVFQTVKQSEDGLEFMARKMAA